MKQLIIIGASGFGRDLIDIAKSMPNYGVEFEIKGFLVHKKEYLASIDKYPQYPPVLGMVDDYKVNDNDVFICSLGDVNEKKKVVEPLIKKGWVFFTIVHPTARVSPFASIDSGTVIEANVTIGSGAHIGKHCLIQTSSIIAHDDIIGDYVRIDCNVVCVGDVLVEEGATIHTSSVINHGVKIGSYSTVGAMSFVIRKVKPGVTVQGNPAKQIIF